MYKNNLYTFFKISLFFLFPTIILISILVNGWVETFSQFNISAMVPIFADSRAIQSSIYALENNYDPTAFNPYDPWGRNITYPIIWTYLADFLNLKNEFNFLLFINIGIFIFFIVVFKIYKKSNFELFSLFIIFSWSNILLIERGNNDFIIFILIFLFITTNKPILKTVLLATSVFLKFYTLPLIFLIKSIKIQIFVLFSSVIYFFSIRDQIENITDYLGVHSEAQYGLGAINAFLDYEIIFFMCSIAISIFLLKKIDIAKNFYDYDFQLFFGSGCIYFFTSLFSVNYDYRLVFLLLALPYIAKLDFYNKFILYITIIASMNSGLFIGKIDNFTIFFIFKLYLLTYFGVLIIKTIYLNFKNKQYLFDLF